MTTVASVWRRMRGRGMGDPRGTSGDTALGDAAADEAGGASGTLNAVRWVAADIGAAAMTRASLAGAG